MMKATSKSIIFFFWRTTTVLVVLSLLALSAYAANPGTTGAQFLRIPVGARPAAMGEAYTALSTDVLGMHWNPAGMSHQRHYQVSAMRMQMALNIDFNQLSVLIPMGERSSYGISYINFGTEDTRRDAPGVILDTFDISDQAFSLGYSYRFTDDFSAGVNLRYLDLRLDQEKATTVSADLGVLYTPDIEGLTVGLSLQNIGGRVTYYKYGDPLPTTLRFGIAHSGLFKNHLTLSADIIKPRELDLRMNVGAEVRVSRLRLRAGYRAGADFDTEYGFTAGAGLNFGGFDLDYAYSPFGQFGSINRVSVTYTFGGGGLLSRFEIDRDEEGITAPIGPLMPRQQQSVPPTPSQPVRPSQPAEPPPLLLPPAQPQTEPPPEPEPQAPILPPAEEHPAQPQSAPSLPQAVPVLPSVPPSPVQPATPRAVALRRAVGVAFTSLFSMGEVDAERDHKVLGALSSEWSSNSNVKLVSREDVSRQLLRSRGLSTMQAARNCGADYAVTGTYDEAEGKYRIHLTVTPTDPAFTSRSGYLSAASENLDEAVEDLLNQALVYFASLQ